MANERCPRRIQSVDTAFEILEALRDYDGLTLTELAETVELSPSTTHTYLATMNERGYVREIDGIYKIGFFTLPLAEYARSHTELFPASKSEIDELADVTGEVTHLIVESQGREIPLYESFGEQAVGENLFTENKGYPRTNLHCSAAGKAILAHIDVERRNDILEEYPFPKRTENTITDEQALQSELDDIRDDGVALNDEEQVDGLRAVGTVIQKEERVLGAVSLSAPSLRLSGTTFREEIPDQVRRTANIIEINLESLD